MGWFRKRRVALALAAGLTAAGGTGVAMAKGGITANLALSGTLFNIAIGNVDGTDFSLFVSGEKKGEEQVPVSRLRFGTADASDLCVSAVLPNVPGVGDSVFTLKVPGHNTVHADNLLVSAPLLRGSLKLDQPQIGIDAKQVNPEAPPASWGIYSNGVHVQAQEIQATSIGANSLTARNFEITVKRGSDHGCHRG